MARVNGFDLDLLNKVADGYNVKITMWSNLVRKEGVSNDVFEEAKKALIELMPEGLDFRLEGVARCFEPKYLDKIKNLTDALEEIQAQRAAEAKKAHAEESYRNRGPMERLNEILGPAYLKYNLKFENGQIVAGNASQEVMIDIYNRLRSLKLPITANIDENGTIIGLRALQAGERPIEINGNAIHDEVRLAVDPTINTEYKNFMDAGIDKPAAKTDTNKTNARKNQATEKYELAIANKDNMKAHTIEEADEENTDDLDKLISNRMDERFKTAEGLQRLTDTAQELNKLFTIDGNLLIAKEGITPEDIEFANTSLEYFYPTTLVMNDEGKLAGLAPIAGYEPLAEIVYSTMRQAAKAQDFADKMAEKKAAQDALIQAEPIDYADYINDYIHTDPSNTSDENEVLYNAIKFAALQAVKPAAERKKYSEIIEERGDESVYTTRDVIESEINSLDVAQRTAYANALNDVREAVLDALPPKTLVEFQEGLSKQLADENLSAEEREELTSKLNSVQSRMDEMINDVADEKVVFNDLQLPEHYEGLVSVIQARLADNPKAQLASHILENDIAQYDKRYGLDGLTDADAELLMDRAIQADRALAEMGLTQVLGRKLKNVVSSNKLSTERKFTISAENDQLLRGILYTDEKGTVVPQMDENGDVFEDSLIFQIEDMAIAYAYNKAVLGEEKITRESIQADVNDFIYSTAVNMVMADMNAKGTPISAEEAEKRVQAISPENPYQVPLSAAMNQVVTQTQQMVGLVDRVGQKIGRTAPVLSSMHERLSRLDEQMANSRFKNEYVKSNRLLNTGKKLITMGAMSAAYGFAFSAGGAALGVGLIAGMTTMRTLAGFAQYKRQMRREGVEAKSFMQYLWSEKAQIAASAASIVAAAGGLAWLSYSVAGLNLANNFRRNLNRDKKAGQSRTIKDGIMGGVETALPMGVSLAMNLAMGGIFADRGDPDASFMDNISNTFSDAFSGLKDVLGFGDAAAGMTPDAAMMDNNGAETATPTDAGSTSDTTTGTGGSDTAAGADATPNGADFIPVNAHTVTPPTSVETVADTLADTTQTFEETGQNTPTAAQMPAASQTTPNGMLQVEDLPNLNTPPLGESAAAQAIVDAAQATNDIGYTTTAANTASATVANTISSAATAINDTAPTVGVGHDAVSGINVPHPDLENQTPPPDATFVQSPSDFAAEAAAREAAQTAAGNTAANVQDNVAATADTTVVQNNTDGTTGTQTGATPSATATSTDTASTAATNGAADTTASTGVENMPEGQAFNHTYDQAAHQHADARIHGQGINYKLDYNETQLNNALDQIRTIGSDYPQMNSAAGQSNAEILMYKLNQVDQLLAPDTDIVTPEGRVEAQALYGHKMPDGSWYGPHDLRADLLAGKDVDPQIAAEIFAKIEPHIDATGHHIGDIHNFKEAGTWSYRQTGVGGYSEDLVPPSNPEFDGVYGHLDESGIPPVTDDINQGVHIVSNQNDTQDIPVPPVTNVNDGQGTPVAPIAGVEQNGSQTPSDVVQDANNPKGAPFVPYIPYDKPYMSKIRRTLNDRIGAWMGPIKRALGIKEDINPKQGEKGTSTQIPPMPQVDVKHPSAYTVHGGGDISIPNETHTTKSQGTNATAVSGKYADNAASKQSTPAGKVPQGPGPKRLVVQESDLPKDPYFNISPISENVERDVNGAWVADFREGAPKINRTVKTANADYVTGKLPNTPTKGEIQPTIMPMGMAKKTADKERLGNQEELPEPRKGLPEPQAIRLGTRQVSNETILMDTQEQQDAFKRQMMDGNVPKHIRAVLEQRARDAHKAQMRLENKEEKAKLTPEQAKALLNKYRDVTAAVDGMKQTAVTQNTSGSNVDLKIKSRQQQPKTQSGNNGIANDANASVWKHLAQKKHKEP